MQHLFQARCCIQFPTETERNTLRKLLRIQTLTHFRVMGTFGYPLKKLLHYLEWIRAL
ncbi:protein of unknown function [Methylocaldum szegediense]|uniref:Uncharacterized protein n=1 Tax=Methylocaldum szegediense TaxID=73780 RepID=A0ABN8XA98_9GAMM|nr:protein of unknown function [Methylocaldum szegediense]